MNPISGRADQFEAHRERMTALAYRMLGSVDEAKDVVQEASIRWLRENRDIRSPEAYLTRVVTNLCLDKLNSARARREEYVGPWLPEPIETGPYGNAAYQTELADSLSMAFLRMLETLTPPERAVFLLREVFRLDYDEIAVATGKTVVNCRQIAHRARKRIQEEGAPRFDVSQGEQRRLMRRFKEAVRKNDLSILKETLAEDIRLYSDGGGKAVAARRPLTGSEEVSRFILGVERKYAGGFTKRWTEVNGEPGFLFLTEGKPHYAWSFHIERERIQSIFVVANPDKLRSLDERLWLPG